MAEIRARVTQATFDRLRAMAENNGVNLTAMVSILINHAGAHAPQEVNNQRTDSGGSGTTSGVVTKVNGAKHSADSGGSGTTSGQIAESDVDLSLGLVGSGRKETTVEGEGGVGAPKKRGRKTTNLTTEQLARFERLYLHRIPELEQFWPFDRDDRATAERNWRVHAEPCTDADVDAWVANIEAQARKRKADHSRDGFLPQKRGAARYFNGKTWRERPEAPPVVAPTETRQKTIEEIVAQYRHLGK